MSYRSGRSAAPLIVLALSSFASLSDHDRLKTMPGYERYQKMSAEIRRSVKLEFFVENLIINHALATGSR